MRKFSFMLIILPAICYYGCNKSNSVPTLPVISTGHVVTYLGTGTAGLQNGTGANVEFNLPTDLALDASGNIYVAEQGNNVIRKISPSGEVATYAGDGKAGYKDGPASTAEFNAPEGMVVDNTGNLYVADSKNNVIRVISQTGQVSTYAGTTTQGYKDGANTSAQFSSPNGLAIDKAGNLYVADYLNNAIRKIASGGGVSTYAGSGTVGLNNGAATTATFNAPSGLAIDASNNLYVADAGNNAVRQISSGGQVSTLASGLNAPSRVGVDMSGNVYFSAGNNTIQKIASGGKVTNYAGNGTAGYIDDGLLTSEFNTPLGLIVSVAGTILVADSKNNMLRLLAQ